MIWQSGYRLLLQTEAYGPTGIAHTYMAAEGIEKAAKAQNCFIKVGNRKGNQFIRFIDTVGYLPLNNLLSVKTVHGNLGISGCFE